MSFRDNRLIILQENGYPADEGENTPQGYVVEFEFLFDADFDEDGDVDGNDLLIWQSVFGNNAGGDTDRDGDTDGIDFLIWQTEFSRGQGTGSGTPVPEPATVTIAAMIAFGLAIRLSDRKRGCS